MHFILVCALSLITCGSLFSQTVVKPPPASWKTEPGLELAGPWKWWVVPSDKKEWGMPLPEALVAKAALAPSGQASLGAS